MLDRLDFLHAAERPRVRERLILADRWVRLPMPHNPGFLPQGSVPPRTHDVKSDRAAERFHSYGGRVAPSSDNSQPWMAAQQVT